MSDGDTVSQVVVVILLLSLAIPTLAQAHEMAGTPIEYEEEVTIDYGGTSEVSQNATLEGYGDDETVIYDGTELTEGPNADYEWNESTGNITWQSSTNTTDGDTATVQYAAYQRTEETALAWTLISPFMALFGLFGLAVSVRAVWNLTAEVWDL